jgi:hypothetical protein
LDTARVLLLLLSSTLVYNDVGEADAEESLERLPDRPIVIRDEDPGGCGTTGWIHLGASVVARHSARLRVGIR